MAEDNRNTTTTTNVRDLDFEILEPLSEMTEIKTLTYRSKIPYTKSVSFFCIRWPKGQRTKVAKIGICRNSSKPESSDPDQSPEVEKYRTWYWNLATKQLEDSKDGPPYKPYPASGEPILEIPEIFWMVLDMNRGTLSFALTENKRNLGVAFDDLLDNELHVTFLEEYGEDEAGKVPVELLRRLGSK